MVSASHAAEDEITSHVARSDKQLADLVLAGDETAFEELFDRHKRLVAAIAARDPDMARAAMSGHLDRSHQRFSAGWSTVTDNDTSRSPA